MRQKLLNVFRYLLKFALHNFMEEQKAWIIGNNCNNTNEYKLKNNNLVHN